MEIQDQNHVVYAFPRGRGEEIQLAFRTFKGKLYVDLRIWYLGKDPNLLLPTRKGISFFPDQLPEFKKGMERLLKAADVLPQLMAAGAAK